MHGGRPPLLAASIFSPAGNGTSGSEYLRHSYCYWPLFVRSGHTGSKANPARFCRWSQVFFTTEFFRPIAGLFIMLPPGLERLRPFEPMRYLHLLYLFFFLIAGGFLADIPPPPCVSLARACLSHYAGMFFCANVDVSCITPSRIAIRPQRPIHGCKRLRGFVRTRPRMRCSPSIPTTNRCPGEDSHGFRALAERSALADYEKDGGMAARVPRLRLDGCGR